MNTPRDDAKHTPGQGDFARIEIAADGAQVLFYKSTDDAGAPQLRQVTDYEGIFAEVNISFSDNPGGWRKLDEAFESAGVTQANDVRAAIAKATGRNQ